MFMYFYLLTKTNAFTNIQEALSKVLNVNVGYGWAFNFGAPTCSSTKGCHCDGAN